MKILKNFFYFLYIFISKNKSKYFYPTNKSVRIIANGPSLSNENINLIDSHDTLMLNFSINNDLFWKLKPKYYVLADDVFFIKNTPEIHKFYKKLLSVNWDIVFFVPLKYFFDFKDKCKSNSNVSVKFFYKIPKLKFCNKTNFEYYLFKKGISSPSSQNVLIPSIFTMINEGYNNIYLYGADHSWLNQLIVNDKNEVCIKDIHYYDSNVILKPWIRGNRPYKMHEILSDLQNTFLQYNKLYEYSLYIGNVKIINMTKNSFIDAFERFKY